MVLWLRTRKWQYKIKYTNLRHIRGMMVTEMGFHPETNLLWQEEMGHLKQQSFYLEKVQRASRE